MKIKFNFLSSTSCSEYGTTTFKRVFKSIPKYKEFSIGDKIKFNIFDSVITGKIKEISSNGFTRVKTGWFTEVYPQLDRSNVSKVE